MIVRELATRLGLDVNAASFAEGNALIEITKAGLTKLVAVVSETATRFVEMVKTTAESGHEIERMSQVTGIASDSLQRLQFAAGKTGTSTDSLNTGIRFLSRNMLEAAKGGNEQSEAFQKLGVHVKDAQGNLRGTDAVLKDVASKFATMPDGAQKVALSMQLLGRSGSELIPLLNLGGAKIEAFGAQATVMNEEQIAASKDLVLAQKQLGAITASIWKGAIYPLIPAIRDLVKQYAAWRKANADVMKQRLKEFIGAGIAAVKALGSAFKFLVGTIQFFKTNWIATMAIVIAGTVAWTFANQALALSFIETQAAAVAAGLAAAGAWLVAAAPVIAIAVGLIAVLAVLDDIRGFFAGEDSAIGEGIDKIFGKGASIEVIKQAGEWWDALKEGVIEAIEAADGFYKILTKIGYAIKEYNPFALGQKLAAAAAHLVGFKGYTDSATPTESPDLYGPPSPSSGFIYNLRKRAAERQADARFLLPEGAAGPQYRPSAYLASSGGSSVVNNNFHVTQLPGENGEHFAQRVAAIAREERESANSDAAAAIPATQ